MLAEGEDAGLFVRLIGAAMACALLGGGCSADLEVPPSAAISCTGDAGCPEGYKCQTSIGQCAPVDEIASSGPKIVLGSASIVPEIAGKGTPVRIRLRASAALGKAAELSLRHPANAMAPIEGPVFSLLRSQGEELEYVFVPSGIEAEIVWTVAVTLTDRFGNVSTHLPLGTLRLDFSPPALVAASASPPVAQAGTEVRVTVEASEPIGVNVDREPSLELRWPGGITATALEDTTSRSPGGRQLVFRYTPTGAEPEQPASVRVAWHDLAGNHDTSEAPGVAHFDFTAPSITALGPDIVPPAGSLLPEVRAATVGSLIQVTVTAPEELAAPPSLSVRDAAWREVATALGVEPVPNQFVIELELDEALDLEDGDYWVYVAARDALPGQPGNLVERQLGTFRFDATPPAHPDLFEPDAILYQRMPWGSAASSGAVRFTMQAAPGTLVDDGYTWLIAIDRKAIALAQPLGRGQVLSDGSVAPFDVIAADVPRPFIVVVDAAGNVSDCEADPGPQATRVRDVEWTATLAGKVAGSFADNPHSAVLTPALQRTLSQASAANAEPDAGGMPALYAPDNVSVSIDGARVWVEPTISVDRPAPRNRHAAAYDTARGRLVLFGGLDLVGGSGETWELDSSNWTRRAPASAPEARQGHAMAYDPTRAQVVLFGGSRAGVVLDDTWTWDGESWQRLAPELAPPARQLHRMAYDARRQVIVLFGGRQGAGELADVWEWDGAQWSERTPSGPGPQPRDSHAMAYDAGREVTVVYGGVTSAAGVFLNDAIWEWDGTSWSRLALLGSRPTPQRNAMTYDRARQRLVLFGQKTWEREDGQWLDVGLGPTEEPAPREYPVLVHAGALGGALMFGGGSGSDCITGDCRNDLWLWDGAAWIPFMDTAHALPESRDRLVMAYHVESSQTVMFGGSFGGFFLNDTWTWAGAGWADETSPGPSPRFRSSMAYGGGRVLLFGGLDPLVQPNTRGDLWSWEPGSGWTDLTPGGASPAPRSAPAVAYDSSRDRLVLYGGTGCTVGLCDKSTCLDTWEWDPGTGAWEQKLSPQNPPALTRHAMAYDAARQRVVLFGGVLDADPGASPCATDGTSDETWEWGLHGAAVCGSAATPCWRPMSVAGEVPQGRGGHTLTSDAGRRRVVLFGGQTEDVNVRFDDTWEWNGVRWRRLETAGPTPRARFGHGLAYDQARDKLVLFGGVDERSTWELDADPAQAPAVVVSFDLTSMRSETAGIHALQVRTRATGRGYQNATTGDGASVSGVTLLAWSSARGEWQLLGASTSGVLDVVSSSPAEAQGLVTADRRVHLALRPTAGIGNGGTPPRVSVDYVELEVKLRQ